MSQITQALPQLYAYKLSFLFFSDYSQGYVPEIIFDMKQINLSDLTSLDEIPSHELHKILLEELKRKQCDYLKQPQQVK